MISAALATCTPSAASAAALPWLGPPADIRLGDIVRLGEESETVIECVEKNSRMCRLAPGCRLKGALDEAAAAFFEVLDGYTLADLGQATNEAAGRPGTLNGSINPASEDSSVAAAPCFDETAAGDACGIQILP